MTAQTNDIRERLIALHDAVAAGGLLEAFEEYYDDDVVMQENVAPPTRGKAENLARERAWLETVAEFRGFELRAFAIEGDVSFAETSMDYLSRDGQEIHMEQVSRARWRDGRIVEERFYHP